MRVCISTAKRTADETLENSIINEVPGGVTDFPAVSLKSRVDQGTAQSGQAGVGSGIILTDQSTVAGHIGVHEGRQPPRLCPPDHR